MVLLVQSHICRTGVVGHAARHGRADEVGINGQIGTWRNLLYENLLTFNLIV